MAKKSGDILDILMLILNTKVPDKNIYIKTGITAEYFFSFKTVNHFHRSAGPGLVLTLLYFI